ncbi:MAG: hemerythrin domain-containing protein [Polyangiaceae bacterium]
MANPLEQMSVKAAGTMKAMKAGFDGLRGVFLHLAEEHGEAGALMKRVSKSADADVRREHWSQIRSELLSHEQAEMAEVYPLLAGNEATRAIVTLHSQEAGQLKEAIATVDAHDFASSAWGAAFERLFTLVQQHVSEEENDFFPKAQEVLSEDQSKVALERYEAAKRAAKGHAD